MQSIQTKSKNYTEPTRRRGRPRTSERAVELRVAAIEVASNLLMTGGPGLSMESVAKSLGVRAPSLYHHFPGGRDEMILAVAEHYCRRFGEALGAIVEGSGTTAEKLRAVAGYFAGTGSVHPYNVLTEERSLISQDARDALQAIFTQKVEAPLLRLVRAGQDAGEFRDIDAELAMRSLLSLLLRLAQMIVDEAQEAILPDFVADLVLNGLSTRGEADGATAAIGARAAAGRPATTVPPHVPPPGPCRTRRRRGAPEMVPQTRQAIRSLVNYVIPTDEPLYTYNLVDPPEGKAVSNQVIDPQAVVIKSIRDNTDHYRLDVHGFELVPFSPSVDDIYDPDYIERQYYPQVIDLIKRHTGASEVRVFIPFLRGEEAQRRMPGSITTPAGTVHVDYTHETGPEYFDRLLGEQADALRGRRFAVINVWRPITGPMRDHPLALCDARSVAPADLMASRSISRSDAKGLRTADGEITTGVIYSVAFNPAHRWYYVPDMMPCEALLLKNYDSRLDGTARFNPHCAFEDPTTPADALPRASIEVRTLAIW